MITDWVLWGSIGTVVGAVFIVAYLGFKIKSLMDKDAAQHKQ